MPKKREASDETAVKSKVRAYLAALPPDSRRILKKVRETIIAAAPGATDQFSYGIPGFGFDGKPLVWSTDLHGLELTRTVAAPVLPT